MILSAIISIFISTASPDSLTVLGRIAEYESDIVRDVSEGNARELFSPLRSLTSAAISARLRDEGGTPLLSEEGSAESSFCADVRSLVRLDSSSAVSGKVGYLNGTRRKVLWNSSSDYLLLYPYVLADSVGGDLRREQYLFSGGWSARRGRWHYGLHGEYRALHEYRQVDPRPRNIVSDLGASVNGGTSVAGGYHIDAELSYRRYSQSQNEGFFNPKGANSSVMHLTGLGGQFSRFAGSTSSYLSTRYAGNGFGLCIGLIPDHIEGWHADLSWKFLEIVHHLPNQNEAPYNYLYDNSIDLRVRYIFRSRGGRLHSLGAGGKAGLRSGAESVLDNGKAGRFIELARFRMYSSGALRSGIEWKSEKAGRPGFKAGAWYRGFSAEYLYPGRGMTYSFADADAGVSQSIQKGLWQMYGSIEAGGSLPLGGRLTIPSDYTDPVMAGWCDLRYRRLSAAALYSALTLKAERATGGKTSLFCRLDVKIVGRKRCDLATYDSISLGINF